MRSSVAVFLSVKILKNRMKTCNITGEIPNFNQQHVLCIQYPLPNTRLVVKRLSCT